MARQIFIVDARVVDQNGTFNHVSGYPKIFDSRSYQDDIPKARRRAEGDMSEAWGAMCKVDTRQLQLAMIVRVSDGNQIALRVLGAIADDPDPEE